MRLGIDVSNLNGIVDWAMVADSGVSVAVLKASEGTYFHDDYFHANFRGARDAGLTVGAYHFARPSANTGAQEARFFCQIVESVGVPDFYVLDQEDDRVPIGAGLVAHSLDFFETTNHIVGGDLWLYSSQGYMRDHGMEGASELGAYKLWLASWQVSEPMKVLPWSEWRAWQFTDRGYTPGVGMVDQSLWRGW